MRPLRLVLAAGVLLCLDEIDNSTCTPNCQGPPNEKEVADCSEPLGRGVICLGDRPEPAPNPAGLFT